MPNRRDNYDKHAQKEIRALGNNLLRDVKAADKTYMRYYDSEPDQSGMLGCFLIFARLLISACIAALFIIIFPIVGWWALGLPILFLLITHSILYAVIAPAVGVVILAYFL
jgi:hypothetical protein